MKHAGENEDELSLKDTTAGGRSFDGKLEGGQKANYMLFVMQGADFLGMLSGDCRTFKPTIKHQTAHTGEGRGAHGLQEPGGGGVPEVDAARGDYRAAPR